MGSFSQIHLMIAALVLLLLFGSGRVSSLIGDLARGSKSFRKTMAEDSAATPRLALEHDSLRLTGFADQGALPPGPPTACRRCR